jgi:hypothetical protein
MPLFPTREQGVVRAQGGSLTGKRFRRRPAILGGPEHGLQIPAGGDPPAAVPAVIAPQGVVATAEYVQGLLESAFSGKFGATNILRLGDAHYYLPTPQEIDRIINDSSLDRKIWTPERFDCDDFAYVLKAEFCTHAYDAGESLSCSFALGMIWGNFNWRDEFHAANLVVLHNPANDRNGVLLIEPKEDAYKQVEDCKGGVTMLTM